MENRFKTPFEEDMGEGLASLKKTLSTLIQYTVLMSINLKVDEPALEFFQELEQQFYQIREKVNKISLYFNINLRKNTPYIVEILGKEINKLSILHKKAANNPKNDYTTTINDLENELQLILKELKRFNHP